MEKKLIKWLLRGLIAWFQLIIVHKHNQWPTRRPVFRIVCLLLRVLELCTIALLKLKKNMGIISFNWSIFVWNAMTLWEQRKISSIISISLSLFNFRSLARKHMLLKLFIIFVHWPLNFFVQSNQKKGKQFVHTHIIGVIFTWA